MMTAVLPLVAVLYVVAATWAVRSGGPRRLWTVAGGAIAAFAMLGIATGLWYAVPSVPLLLLYLALILGPMVLLTALALTPGGVRAAPFPRVVILAAVAAIVGLTLGIFAAVWGFALIRL